MAHMQGGIAALLHKMEDSDKDIRYMATLDLIREIERENLNLDQDLEKRVTFSVLKLVDDPTGEVQNIAIRVFKPLVRRFRDQNVENVVETLCSKMAVGVQQNRDIASIALKQVICEMSPTAPNAIQIAKKACAKMVLVLQNGRAGSRTCSQQDDDQVQLEALDIITVLLTQFGPHLMSNHTAIKEQLFVRLQMLRTTLRKRAINALGQLVVCCHASLFDDWLKQILELLSQSTDPQHTRTYVQCIAQISKQAGHRVNVSMFDKILSLIIKLSRRSDDDDELKEYCLQALDAFIRRCPQESIKHIDDIVKVCLELVKHDPNYQYDDESDGEADGQMDVDKNGATGDDDDAGSDEFDDIDSDDDDDSSWKVRRAAAKTLEAVIAMRKSLLPQLYVTMGPSLVSRFREREENVRVDIINCYATLLRKTHSGSMPAPLLAQCSEHLRTQLTALLRATNKHLRSKCVRSRQACLLMLIELIHIEKNILADQSAFTQVTLPAVFSCILDKSAQVQQHSALKLDALHFLTGVIETHNVSVLVPHVPAITAALLYCIDDQFYKVVAAALTLCAHLIIVVRPDRGEPLPVQLVRDQVSQLYNPVLERFRATDIDAEVKEPAIECMAHMLARAVDCVPPSAMNDVLPLFVRKCGNETTRLAGVKSLALMASSPCQLDLSSIFVEVTQLLTTFLRKHNRALRNATLLTLSALCSKYGQALNDEMVRDIIVALKDLLGESDQQIAYGSLNLARILAGVCPSATAGRASEVLVGPLMELVRSPLLQGQCLDGFTKLAIALMNTGNPEFSFQQWQTLLPTAVLSTAGSSGQAPGRPLGQQGSSQTTSNNGQAAGSQMANRSTLHAIAQSLTVLAMSGDRHNVQVLLNQLLSDLNNPETSDPARIYLLIAIGEVGRRVDLHAFGKNVQDTTLRQITNSLDGHHEEVKTAASFALGAVSVGNLEHFLSAFMEQFTGAPMRHYLLLHSVKEIVSFSEKTREKTSAVLQPYLNKLWDLLMKFSTANEEGTRNVVSECLGKLCQLYPTSCIPQLVNQLKNQDPLLRSTIVTAFKCIVADPPSPSVEVELSHALPTVLECLNDADLKVRRLALVTFKAMARNRSEMLAPHIDRFIPMVYRETVKNNELVRIVEMGPFKHIVDDGLELRKAAYECLCSLLEDCVQWLDVFTFASNAIKGLSDDSSDIKLLTYLMVVRMAENASHVLLQNMETVTELIRKNLSEKPKNAQSSVGDQRPSADTHKAAFRAIIAMERIQEASDRNKSLADLVLDIERKPELRDAWNEAQKEQSSRERNTRKMSSLTGSATTLAERMDIS